MLEIVRGNILYADTKYIAHQCNCITTKSKGLSKIIFDRHPYADIYSSRPEKVDYKNLPEGQKAGTIIIKGNDRDQRYIINMLSQIYPGPPKFIQSKLDGESARIKYFIECLDKISKIENLESIAFPYGVGCGLAGGNWNIYFPLLKGFAKHIHPTPVILYKFD